MKYFVYIKDILGVKTNLNEFSWVYGRVAPETNEAEYEKCKIKINIQIKKTKDVFEQSVNLQELDKYSYFYAKENENKLYYDRNLIFDSKLRYSIEIIDNHIDVNINKNYYKLIKFRFMNLHSLSYILADIVSGLLLLNDYVTIHCSSVKIFDSTIVIFGPPGIGKTITAIQLCENKDVKFISEDMAITDGVNIYSVPWTNSVRFYNHENDSKIDKFINNIKRAIPILQLIYIRKRKSIHGYLKDTELINHSEITDILLLGKGEQERILDSADLFEELINLNKYEFNYHKSPFMLAFSYFNPEFSIDEMYNIEKSIISKILNNSNQYKILSNNPLRYSDIINEGIILNNFKEKYSIDLKE